MSQPSQPSTPKPRRRSYAEREYGVTAKELDAFVKRMNRQIASDRTDGKLVTYTGDLEADLKR